MSHLVPGVLTLLALSGCAATQVAEPYYADEGAAPVVSSLDVTSELGNMGGHAVTITGSRLGDDPTDVVVTLGGHNAKVVAATGDTLQITTPQGPMSGGLVDLVIATAAGYVWREDAYSYDVEPYRVGETALYPEEASYLAVQNLWTSCYGGMWDHSDPGGDELEGSGCERIAYIGATGIAGTSEWWKSPWPRGHTAQLGLFVGATDFPDGWRVETDFVAGSVTSYDKVRERIGEVWFENQVWSGETRCVDPSADPADNEVDCDASGARTYKVDELHFCETYEADGGGTQVYTADWPVKEDFFQSASEEQPHYSPVDVTLYIQPDPTVDPTATALRLPGEIKFRAAEGFDNSVAWAASGGTNDCLDGVDGGSALLSEAGIVLTWDPIDPDAEIGGDNVLATQSYVRVSITWLPLSWFGPSAGGPRATVIVPDTDGRVEIPNEVMYQFPTPNGAPGSYSDITKQGHLATWEDEGSIILLDAYRVTDMLVDTDGAATARAPTIVSYATGDLSFLQWSNPTDRDDDCDDCVDGDGDGWVDDADPDCAKDGTGIEENATSDSSCNDGVDNNGDGKTDSEDELCKTGSSGESDCDDGRDNDEDGWTDELDAECLTGDQEAGEDDPAATCSDGKDNDGDGWIDGGDLACKAGADLENDGFTGTACNDDKDNDDHGDVDANDPYCADAKNGPSTDEETPAAPTAQCADGVDNDDDGFLDGLDPDCEYSPGTRELVDFFEPGDKPVIPLCYDGVDNDLDGLVDALDPSCWSPLFDYAPDGFLNDEAASDGGECTDTLDGDGDGWIDGQDPDCQPGKDTQVEVGFGTKQCNDGTDNDGDGNSDKEDTSCSSAVDNNEG